MWLSWNNSRLWSLLRSLGYHISEYDLREYTLAVIGLQGSLKQAQLKYWGTTGLCLFHDDVTKWKHFLRNWSFVRGIHRSRWIPHTKASDAELWFFFDLRLKKQLSKQSWGWWFETLSCQLWRHCDVVSNAEDQGYRKIRITRQIAAVLRAH